MIFLKDIALTEVINFERLKYWLLMHYFEDLFIFRRILDQSL